MRPLRVAPAALVLAALLAATPPALPREGPPAPPAAAPADAEALATAAVDASSCGTFLRTLASGTRLAGTPGADAARRFVAERFREWGYAVEEPAYEVLLSYPERIRVEALPGGGAPAVAVLDSDAPRGPEQTGEGGLPFPFNAWSGSGVVEGPLVDGGYGGAQDLDALEAAGTKVRGAVVLVRYGRFFRGLKAKEAEARGAVAVLIYSDPSDDGAGKGPAFPAGPWRPDDAVQRGSLQDIALYPGDVLTPGRPAKAGEPRLVRADVAVTPRIPCVPLAASEARRLLDLVGGLPPAPGPAGALRLAPGAASRAGAKVRVDVRMKEELRTIRNVVATWPGAGIPDRRVLAGSHRDSWCPGAADAASGTAVLLETARAVAAAARAGRPPRRTVQFCSWDAEEYGLVGSVEWCEEHADALSREAVAYFNADPGVTGPDLGLAAAPALFPLLRDAASSIPDPKAPGRSLWDPYFERVTRDPAEASRGCPCGVLGSGSDYTAFLERLGVPSADLQFSGPYGVYHSVHDGIRWMETQGDPGYARHADLARLLAVAVLRTANADVPHLSYAAAGEEAARHLAALRAAHPDAPVEDASREAALLRVAGMLLDLRRPALAAAATPEARREAETLLLSAERAFLDPVGLPGRPWYRHLVYAPGTATGYASDPMPALAEALRRGDARGAAAAAANIARALKECRARVDRARAALEAGDVARPR